MCVHMHMHFYVPVYVCFSVGMCLYLHGHMIYKMCVRVYICVCTHIHILYIYSHANKNMLTKKNIDPGKCKCIHRVIHTTDKELMCKKMHSKLRKFIHRLWEWGGGCFN